MESLTLTYPTIEVGPWELERLSHDGFADVVLFKMSQQMRVLSFAGLLPLLTFPGHE